METALDNVFDQKDYDNSYRREFWCWLGINCLICQIPIFFNYLTTANTEGVLTNGLSYLFTLLVTSLYMLIFVVSSYSKNLIQIVAIGWSFVVIGVYLTLPHIKIDWIKCFIDNNHFVTYLIFMFISQIVAYKLCAPSLMTKVESELDKQAMSRVAQNEAVKRRVSGMKDGLEKEDYS